MITLHRNLTCLSMVLVYYIHLVMSFPGENSLIQKRALWNYDKIRADSKDNINKNSMRSAITRHKRSSSTFKDAGETSQMKVVQMFAQLFKNYYADKPIGGRHPFDPTVPLIFCKILNTKLLETFD